MRASSEQLTWDLGLEPEVPKAGAEDGGAMTWALKSWLAGLAGALSAEAVQTVLGGVVRQTIPTG